MKHHDFYMLSDDMKDFARDANHISTFVITLGKEWMKTRAKHYKTMPATLLRMLDEIGDAMVCEEKGCRELVHGDWDFCKVHGDIADKAEKPMHEKLFPDIKYKAKGKPKKRKAKKKKRRAPVAHPGQTIRTTSNADTRPSTRHNRSHGRHVMSVVR